MLNFFLTLKDILILFKYHILIKYTFYSLKTRFKFLENIRKKRTKDKKVIVKVNIL